MVQQGTKECADFLHRARYTIFYKKIDSSFIRDKKMMIPGKFKEKCGDGLSPVVTLKVVNGSFWRVGLMKEQNRLWFQRGWIEFIEHHSIKEGYFLVFSYEGNSNFSVYIFDLKDGKLKTGFPGIEEISHKHNFPVACVKVEKDSSDSSLEIFSFSPTWGRTSDSFRNVVVDLERCVDKPVFSTIPDLNLLYIQDGAWLGSTKPSRNCSTSDFKEFKPKTNCMIKKRKSDIENEDRRGEITQIGLKRAKSRRTNVSYVPHLKGYAWHISKSKRIKSLFSLVEAWNNGVGLKNSSWENEREVNFIQKSPEKQSGLESDQDDIQNKFRNGGKKDETTKQTCESQRTEKLSMSSKQASNGVLHAATKLIPCYPCFQIIVMPPDTRKGPMIPENFVEKCGGELSSVITLKVINSPFWKMGLKKKRNNLWFDWGWPEFIEQHSIIVGCHLVFSYEGNSEFSVYIYHFNEDKLKTSFTGLERTDHKNSHPVACINDQEASSLEILKSQVASINVEEDSSVEIFSSLPFRRTSNSLRNDVVDLDHSVDKSVSSTISDLYFPIIQDGIFLGSMKPNGNSSSSKNRKFNCMMEKRKRNLEMAYQTERTKFGGFNLVKSKRTSVSYASCNQKKTTNGRKQDEAKAERSMEQTKGTLRMKINLNSACSTANMTDDRENQMLKSRMNETLSIRSVQTKNNLSNPYFQITMKPSYTTQGPHISSSFSIKYFKDKSSIRVEVSGGTSCMLGLNWHKKSYVKFSKGWLGFVRTNKLQVGDICEFELLDKDNAVLKASFLRNVEYSSVGCKKQTCQPQMEENLSIGGIHLNKNINAMHEAAKYVPRYPFFQVKITASTTRKGPHVPTYFVRKYLKAGKSAVRVEVCGGTSSFTLGLCWPKHECSSVKLTKGWLNFALRNKIKVGDVCVFELVEKEKADLSVNIFRN